MNKTYKIWMYGHVIGFSIYLSCYIFLTFMDFKDKFPFDYSLLLQTFLAIVLWLLIKKRLFIPAYYLACIIVVLASYSFFAYSSEERSFLPQSVNQIFEYILYIAAIFFALFIYTFLAYYPNKVMKTAKKLNLTNT